MPHYITRIPAEVHFGLNCPFCSNIFKTKSGILSHAKHCVDNDNLDDDLEDIIVWEDITALDWIECQVEISKFVKELASSNMLATIQTQTPEEIREYIRAITHTRVNGSYIDEYDIYRIYEYFFGLTEADIECRKKEMCERLKNNLWN